MLYHNLIQIKVKNHIYNINKIDEFLKLNLLYVQVIDCKYCEKVENIYVLIVYCVKAIIFMVN